MSCRSRPVTRLPSASFLLDSHFLSGVPTSIPFGLCPLSRLLLFLCFSVCLHPPLLQFFPDRLPFFCGPPLPFPTHNLPFLLTGPLAGPPPLPPTSTSRVISHVASQAAKLPMSIITIGVGQAEFDGESPPPPDVFPQRLQALGSDPSQKSKDSHPGLCETVWVSRQGVRVRLFAQGGVCQGAYPTPTPQGCGEEAPSHSSSLHPGILRGVGAGRAARDWAPPVSWLQLSHL